MSLRVLKGEPQCYPEPAGPKPRLCLGSEVSFLAARGPLSSLGSGVMPGFPRIDTDPGLTSRKQLRWGWKRKGHLGLEGGPAYLSPLGSTSGPGGLKPDQGGDPFSDMPALWVFAGAVGGARSEPQHLLQPAPQPSAGHLQLAGGPRSCRPEPSPCLVILRNGPCYCIFSALCCLRS